MGGATSGGEGNSHKSSSSHSYLSPSSSITISADLTHDEDTRLTFLACSEDGAAGFAAAAEAAEVY